MRTIRPRWRSLIALSVAVAVLAVPAVAIGCAGPSATTTTTTTPPPTTTTTAPLGTVEVLGVWSGEELDSFNAMVAPWQQQTGGKVEFTGTRDLPAVLNTRVQSGTPPDIAILPNPGQMNQFAKAGNLKALSDFLDMTKINQDYAKGWVDLGTVNGKLYAIFIKAADKGCIWYNPKTFTANSWTIPKTWDELIALSDKIVADKKVPPAPWSIGVESGAASGWPATDWMAQILLNKYGGTVYDQLVSHQIAWTDPKIKDVWEQFGKIVFTEGYVPGGATAVLATNFQDASYLPFDTPSKAAMYYEGDFVQGFIKNQFPSLAVGTDYAFFPFPTIDAQYAGAVTGGADLVVAFKDTPTVRSFVAYMASAPAQDIWVKRGGFTSVNKQVSLDDYPDAIAKAAAQQLASAPLFRFGAGDSMPSAVQTAWWQGVLQYLQDPTKLDSALAQIEALAKTSY